MRIKGLFGTFSHILPKFSRSGIRGADLSKAHGSWRFRHGLPLVTQTPERAAYFTCYPSVRRLVFSSKCIPARRDLRRGLIYGGFALKARGKEHKSKRA